MSRYVVNWTHGNGRTQLYAWAEGRRWGATNDLGRAKRFASKRAARAWFDGKHRYPKDYAHCWQRGIWRVVAVDQPELALSRGEGR